MVAAKLTKAQIAFLRGIKPHLDYRMIGQYHRTARALEDLGYVKISMGLFATITDAGRALLSPETHPHD